MSPHTVTEPVSFVHAFREAAPYIHYLRGKTVVLAISSEVVRAESFALLAQDLNLLASLGVQLVLVHGVRDCVNELMQAAGLSLQYHQGRRITDETTLEKVKQACGMMRYDIEAALSMGQPHAPTPTRLKIASGNFLSARPLGILHGVDMVFTGSIRKIDTHSIRQRLNEGCLVLVSPLGHSLSGRSFNLSLDEVAGELAMALQAEKLVFIGTETAVVDAEGQRISNLTADEAEQLLHTVPQAESVQRMLPALIKAVRHQVSRAQLISGLTDGSLFQELFTRNGTGTSLAKSAFVSVREANGNDIPDIIRLIRPLEEEGVLLHRSREYLENPIHEFSVLEHDRQVYGCVALKRYPGSAMAELACLVVAPEVQDEGYGEILLQHVQQQGRACHLSQIFALTTHTGDWFHERGFVDADLSELPPERQAQYRQDGRCSKIYVKTL